AEWAPCVEQAEERGEVPPGTDHAEVVRAVSAPLYYRFLVSGDPVDVPAADRAARAAAAAARAGAFTRRPASHRAAPRLPETVGGRAVRASSASTALLPPAVRRPGRRSERMPPARARRHRAGTGRFPDDGARAGAGAAERYLGRPRAVPGGQRSGRKNSRTSAVRASGSSRAAKWPPRSASVQRTTVFSCSA